jgi:hypothetical protein
MSSSTTPTSHDHEEDVLDIFFALIHIWIALEAVRKTLPEQPANSVALASEGMLKVMGGLMKRYDIKVSIDRGDEGCSDE